VTGEPWFVASSFWFVLMNGRDPLHKRARDLLETHEPRLVTSSFVMAETASLLTKRRTKAIAVTFVETVVGDPDCAVAHPTREQLEAAVALFTSRPDWGFDIVDAVSFTLMRDTGIQQALTLDGHFVQMGFAVMPP